MLDAVHGLNTESVIKVEGLVIRRPGSNTNKVSFPLAPPPGVALLICVSLKSVRICQQVQWR